MGNREIQKERRRQLHWREIHEAFRLDEQPRRMDSEMVIWTELAIVIGVHWFWFSVSGP